MDVSVVFINGKSLFSRIIRFVTRCNVTHVYIEMPDGNAVQAEWYNGVSILPASKAAEESDEVARFLIKDVNMERVLSKTGDPYDWSALHIAVIGSILRRKISDKDNRYICTEIATEAIYGKSFAMTPGDLLKELRKEFPNE